ncbi:response regulator [Ramlibacter sp. MAHUQ-53]
MSILIVDDQPDKHLVLRSILADLGERIVSARSGCEALARVLDDEFAVILLDVNMPDIDGLETARLIRGHRRSAQTPIVFISAYVDDLQARRGYALGAVDCISSPVVPEVLRSKVRVFVDLFRLNRQLQLRAEEREALARAEAARAAAEAAVDRADYLAQASEVLARSLDLAQTRDALLRLAVPRLGERAQLIESDAASRLGGPLCALAGRALASGEALAHEEEGQACAVIPLRPGEPSAGALLVHGPAGCFDAARLALARELASRAGMAMENARLYAEVRTADRRKNEFLAMLAHELRNPLAPIRNAVHILQGADVAPPTLAWARDVISRQAEHMARLIDDLLDVSRIVQGKVVVKPESLALAAVVERAVEATAPRLAARGQSLRLALPPAPVVVEGDMVRLAQVLSNLVTNASKFSPPGSVIDLCAAMEADGLVLRVRDQGCGIEPAFLPHVFELFVQGDPSLDRSQGGLGIGLTLVRHLVELHGGRVEACSEGPGRGAEFVVRLPARAGEDLGAAGGAGRPPVRRDGGRARGRRVLVVDDLPASAETLTLLLEMEGFEVRVAHEGPAALALACEFRPDVVLLDIGLPGMNGFEVAGHLRAQEATRDAVLVALTGYGEAESRTRSAQAGFDRHLVKPADVDELLAMLSDPRLCSRGAEA